MSKKLFVGGLSWDTTDQSLRQAFERFGAVTEAKVVTDRETGRSRGFGFVTFNDPAEAQAALSGMDGQPLEGRTIRVNEAQERAPGDRPRGPRPDGGGGYGGRGGGGGGGFGGGGGGGYGGGGGGGYGGGGDGGGGRGGRGGGGRGGGGRGGGGRGRDRGGDDY